MEYVSTDNADVPQKALPYLQSVVKGSNLSLRSAMFKDQDPETVIQTWRKELDSTLSQADARLSSYEDKEEGNIGPKSVRLPLTERLPDVESYYLSTRTPTVDVREVINDTLFHPGIHQNRAVPISGWKAAENLPMNTNSGLPWFSKRKFVKGEAIAAEKAGNYEAPAVIGWRGQSNGTDIPKQRVVWIVSFKTNIREARYTQVAHNYLRNFPCFAAWIGMDAVDHEMTNIFNTELNGVILSSDQTKWDQHTGIHQSQLYSDWMYHYFQTRVHDEIRDWISNVMNMPLVISPTTMITGEHALASGSGATSQLNSVVNAKMQLSSPYTYSMRSLFLGDDGVTLCSDLDRHLDFVNSIGYDVNPDKQLFGTDVAHFLQRLYLKDYTVEGINRGIYMTMRALGAVLYPERFHPADKWSSALETLRWIMIVENTKWHPAFVPFVRFIIKGDRYVKRNVKELLDSKKILQVAKSIPGFIPQYTQELSLDTPLSTFHTVKVIKESLKL